MQNVVQWRSMGKAYVQRPTFNFWNWTELKLIDDDRFSLPEIQESANSLRHFQVHHTHKVSSTIAPLLRCVLFEAMLIYIITVYHARVDHDCAGVGTHQLVESSVGVRPSKWDCLVSCHSYHRRYWPGVLWFALLILLRCTVERGYVGPAKVYFVEVIDKLDNGDHTVEFYSGNPKRTKETLTLRIWNKF